VVAVVGDIDASRPVHNRCLAKRIRDAAWPEFHAYLASTAAGAGRQDLAIHPGSTTQDCSRCGQRQLLPLSAHLYNGPCCGLVLNRDHNAALTILARGLAGIGCHSGVATPR
jgi:putative transposase